MKFIAAINAGGKNTEFSAQLFHELCGYTDLSPKITDLKGDPNVLISIAAQMKKLLTENIELKRKVTDSQRKEEPSKPGFFSPKK